MLEVGNVVNNKLTYTLEYFSKLLLDIQGYIALALPYYLSHATAHLGTTPPLPSGGVASPQAQHPSAPTVYFCLRCFKLHGSTWEGLNEVKYVKCFVTCETIHAERTMESVCRN